VSDDAVKELNIGPGDGKLIDDQEQCYLFLGNDTFYRGEWDQSIDVRFPSFLLPFLLLPPSSSFPSSSSFLVSLPPPT
jgi:hypothetical protein